VCLAQGADFASTEIIIIENANSKFVILVSHSPRIVLGVSLRSLSSRHLRDFIFSNFLCCSFEMAEDGFLRAFLPIVGGVELLFSASFFSCSFEMAEGFSRAFLPTIGGVEILLSASFFCCFEMA
jgi:hypothetical protein